METSEILKKYVGRNTKYGQNIRYIVASLEGDNKTKYEEFCEDIKKVVNSDDNMLIKNVVLFVSEAIKALEDNKILKDNAKCLSDVLNTLIKNKNYEQFKKTLRENEHHKTLNIVEGEENKQLKEKIENLQKENENLQKENEDLQKKNENLQKENENLQKENENLQKENENLQKENEDLREKVMKKTNIIRKRLTEKLIIQTENKELQTENKELQQFKEKTMDVGEVFYILSKDDNDLENQMKKGEIIINDKVIISYYYNLLKDVNDICNSLNDQIKQKREIIASYEVIINSYYTALKNIDNILCNSIDNQMEQKRETVISDEVIMTLKDIINIYNSIIKEEKEKLKEALGNAYTIPIEEELKALEDADNDFGNEVKKEQMLSSGD